VRQFITARDVIGLTNPPPLGCYDMNAVGMGGFVTARGWLELGSYGSSKMKIAYYNINNAARSTKSMDEDGAEVKSVDEFILALRTLRSAAQFACPWNYSYLALENYFHHKEFMKEELRGNDNPARTLCQFSDFVLSENSNRWRDGSGFICFGECRDSGMPLWAPGPRAVPPTTPGTSPSTPMPRVLASRSGNIPGQGYATSGTLGTARKQPGPASASGVKGWSTSATGGIPATLRLPPVVRLMQEWGTTSVFALCCSNFMINKDICHHSQ
jgi:hypothetical protein